MVGFYVGEGVVVEWEVVLVDEGGIEVGVGGEYEDGGFFVVVDALGFVDVVVVVVVVGDEWDGVVGGGGEGGGVVVVEVLVFEVGG